MLFSFEGHDTLLACMAGALLACQAVELTYWLDKVVDIDGFQGRKPAFPEA